MEHTTQNERILTVGEDTLVIGIDIGSEAHYARAFDWRIFEYSKKPFVFENSDEGFEKFLEWANTIAALHEKSVIIPGMEPTGHYWFGLGEFLKRNGIRLVHVDPHHVKKSKELDDGSPTKNDRKDPKVIAGLVAEGRFIYPYIPDGVYAEIRSLSNLRFQARETLTRIKNRLARWLGIYFPEYKSIYKNVDSVSGLMVIEEAPLPCDIVALGSEGINRIWRKAKIRGAGLKRAKALFEAANSSIGSRNAPAAARLELRNLLQDYRLISERLADLTYAIEECLDQIPNACKLCGIKGVGMLTVGGFVAEVGDISRFNDARQLRKLAGFAIVESSSGKHKGESRISYRGRKRLRYVLYEAAVAAIAHNPEFKALHTYYTTREKNPLKKMQSVIAVACKLIRVFFVILKKGVDYDGEKLLRDIRRRASEST